MKKTISLAVVLVLCISAMAQKPALHDRNIDAICSYIVKLRNQPEKYLEVRQAMTKDTAWTMMSEIADSCTIDTRKNLCRLRDKVEYTGINDIAFQVEQARGTLPESVNSFCNGNDPDYNYSFHEFKIMAGKSVASRITGGSRADKSGRTGPQLFLIVPYNPGTIEAGIHLNGVKVPAETTEEGYIRFIISQSVMPEDRIDITISNTSSENQSAVIINHNSRML